MENPTTIQEIVQRFENLSPKQKLEVLDFTMELSGELPEGTPIKEFLKFAGTIPLEGLEKMKQAIEEGCGMASLSRGQHTEKH